MKIYAEGPKGEKFEATCTLLQPTSYDARSYNASQESSMQKAFETWCMALGTTSKESIKEKKS